MDQYRLSYAYFPSRWQYLLVVEASRREPFGEASDWKASVIHGASINHP